MVHYLQIVNLAQGAGTYTLYSFQLSVNFNTGITDQGLILEFLTPTSILSSSSANALASAIDLGGVSGVVAAPGSAVPLH